jgi:hypothetical protein
MWQQDGRFCFFRRLSQGRDYCQHDTHDRKVIMRWRLDGRQKNTLEHDRSLTPATTKGSSNLRADPALGGTGHLGNTKYESSWHYSLLTEWYSCVSFKLI